MPMNYHCTFSDFSFCVRGFMITVGHHGRHFANEYSMLFCCWLHRGVVTVDVDLYWLDINQCPQDYFMPNAFKDTARCHYDTTYVCIS